MSREKRRFFRKFVENLSMDFYEKVKRHVKIRKLTIDGYFSSLFSGDKNKESFSGWKKRHIYPRADEAIVIAKDMHTTVEELVDGEKGEQYLKEYVHKKGWEFEPPDRIADIVDLLDKLSDRDLGVIKKSVKAMLGIDEEPKEEPQAQPGEVG